MKVVLNHVAILVNNIESSLQKLNEPTAVQGAIEDFPLEGTRETYLGSNDQMGRLLLMQVIGEGPYQNTLKKRGPGLHHVALDVQSVDSFVKSLTGSGWLLHPKSLEFYKNSNLVFLCRPGVPFLIEVQEKKKFIDDNYYIEEVSLPFKENRLLDSLCCNLMINHDEIRIKIKEKLINVKNLL